MVLLASVQSLGAIESKREAFSRSTFSFDYETIVKNVGKAIFFFNPQLHYKSIWKFQGVSQ